MQHLKIRDKHIDCFRNLFHCGEVVSRGFFLVGWFGFLLEGEPHITSVFVNLFDKVIL